MAYNRADGEGYGLDVPRSSLFHSPAPANYLPPSLSPAQAEYYRPCNNLSIRACVALSWWSSKPMQIRTGTAAQYRGLGGTGKPGSGVVGGQNHPSASGLRFQIVVILGREGFLVCLLWCRIGGESWTMQDKGRWICRVTKLDQRFRWKAAMERRHGVLELGPQG
eukprot:gene12958-biopygen11034